MTVCAWLLSLGVAAAAQPAKAEQRELLYEILRNGSPVGTHRVVLNVDGDAMRAEAHSTITVRLLGIPVYRFEYRSYSRWEDGRMTSLDVVTNDDGTTTRITGRAEGTKFQADGPDGTVSLPAGIFPTDHWNPGVIGAHEILNTISGRLNRVRMVAQGREERPTGQGTESATRYVYSGDLDATVWYDDRGSWVGLRFGARDGSAIEYVCRKCGPVIEMAERPK